MILDELIEILKSVDPKTVVPIGFGYPHSHRGAYHQLAFEIQKNVSVGFMLDEAESALGSTYGGYRGGEFTMYGSTECYITEREGKVGEQISSLLMHYMLGITDKYNANA